MKIDLSKLVSLISPKKQLVDRSMGIQIIIADRGFVFAGETSFDSEFLTVRNAKCIVSWGVADGLVSLANGPLDTTVVRPYGTVRLPIRSVIALIQCSTGW